MNNENNNIQNAEDVLFNKATKEKKPEKMRKITGDTFLFAFVFIFFAIYSFLLIYPMFWGLMSSFKERLEYRREPFALPAKLLWENYPKALQRITDGGFTFFGMFWNSLWFAGGSCLISLEFITAYAYVLNKYKFAGRNFLYNLCIFWK